MIELTIALLAATLQAGTPILYATLGEIFTEKAGVLNLGVEGIMLCGALAGFAVAKVTGSPVCGILAAGGAGSLLAMIHGIVCLWFLGNQVVSGLALTILGTGLANYLGTPFVGIDAPGFQLLPIPVLSDIPYLGPIMFQQNLLVYISYLFPPALIIFFKSTRFGLGLRAAGEYPAALTAAGLSVRKYRLVAILCGGLLMGIGGGYLSLAYTHLWTNNLTGGRGWIAVALVIFAFWKPGRAAFGAYLFGGIMALQMRMQASGTQLPSSLLLMLPYFLTVLVLVISSSFRSSTGEPAGLGVNIHPDD